MYNSIVNVSPLKSGLSLLMTYLQCVRACVRVCVCVCVCVCERLVTYGVCECDYVSVSLCYQWGGGGVSRVVTDMPDGPLHGREPLKTAHFTGLTPI